MSYDCLVKLGKKLWKIVKQTSFFVAAVERDLVRIEFVPVSGHRKPSHQHPLHIQRLFLDTKKSR